MTELVTPRLLLRDFRLADEAAVHAYASDPKATVFTDWGPNDTAATREFIVQAAAEANSPTGARTPWRPCCPPPTT